jgi:hypothetical protein
VADQHAGDTPAAHHPNGAQPPSPDAAALPLTAEGAATGSNPGGRRPEPVSDEDRNRFGMLLDKAAERGLLSAADYEVRLRDLAVATSTEEMVAIVTDLPAFAPAPVSGTPGTSPPSIGLARRGDRTSPWLLLVVLVAIIVAAIVILGLYVAHLHRTPATGPPPAVARTFSVLRL